MSEETINNITGFGGFAFVAGWIVFLVRWMVRSGTWSLLPDPESEIIGVSFRKIQFASIGTTVFRNSLRIGSADQSIVLKPSLFFRVLGYKSKSIPMKSFKYRGNGKGAIVVGGRKIEFEIHPADAMPFSG